MAAHVHFQHFLLKHSQPVRIWPATLWYVTQCVSQMHRYADVGWIACSHTLTIQNGTVHSLKNKSQTTRKIFSSFLISRVNRVHLVWQIPFLQLVQMWKPVLFTSFYRSFSLVSKEQKWRFFIYEATMQVLSYRETWCPCSKLNSTSRKLAAKSADREAKKRRIGATQSGKRRNSVDQRVAEERDEGREKRIKRIGWNQ